MSAAPKRTRRQAAIEMMCSRALRACCRAVDAYDAEQQFRIDELPEDQRRAAHALLHAALAHCLGSPAKAPKTLTWFGRRWYLTASGKGSLQVSAYPKYPGLVSMPGSLF